MLGKKSEFGRAKEQDSVISRGAVLVAKNINLKTDHTRVLVDSSAITHETFEQVVIGSIQAEMLQDLDITVVPPSSVQIKNGKCCVT